MKDEVRNEILNLFEEAKEAIETKNIKQLESLSDHTLHCTTIYGEKEAIMSAILFYSLSKILEKEKTGEEDVFSDLINGMYRNITAAIRLLKHKKDDEFSSLLKESLNLIKRFDKSFSSYVQAVIEFAKVQKGAKIYEHGLSLTGVSKLLGISKWELMQKVGERKEKYKIKENISPSERLKMAKRLLG